MSDKTTCTTMDALARERMAEVGVDVDESVRRLAWIDEVQDRLPRPLVPRGHGSLFAKAFTVETDEAWRRGVVPIPPRRCTSAYRHEQRCARKVRMARKKRRGWA